MQSPRRRRVRIYGTRAVLRLTLMWAAVSGAGGIKAFTCTLFTPRVNCRRFSRGGVDWGPSVRDVDDAVSRVNDDDATTCRKVTCTVAARHGGPTTARTGELL